VTFMQLNGFVHRWWVCQGSETMLVDGTHWLIKLPSVWTECWRWPVNEREITSLTRYVFGQIVHRVFIYHSMSAVVQLEPDMLVPGTTQVTSDTDDRKVLSTWITVPAVIMQISQKLEGR